MQSMTGYGKAEYKQDGISLSVEIKTVNNRFLDLNLRCPRSFISLEENIKGVIKSHLTRGKADVYINLSVENCEMKGVDVNLDLAKAYYDAGLKIKKQIPSISKNTFGLYELLKMPDVLKQGQEEFDLETFKPIIESTVALACENLNTMRSFEGEKLKTDLLTRILKIEELVKNVEKRAPMVAEDYSAKLKERVQKALEGVIVDEARLVQEVAIFTDKCNIDEELTRLKSHISQFRSICESKNEIGKKLDFLVQEFNREANTICSKSNDITVTDNALELKCEIEKVREQIQNVE